MSGITLQFRPMSEFIGQFKLPAADILSDRLMTNLKYYFANYLAVFALILTIYCVQHPNLLFTLLVIGATGTYLFSINNRPLILGSTVIDLAQQRAGFAAISTALFLYVGGWHAVYVLALGCLISLLHATLRARSISARASVGANKMKQQFNK